MSRESSEHVVANNQTYLLQLTDRHNNTLFVQLSRNGQYWTVNSAGIFNEKYSRRRPEVYTRPALGPGTNTGSSGVDSGRTKGVTAPAGDSPQTSGGKGTENISTGQENGEKNVERETVGLPETQSSQSSRSSQESAGAGSQGTLFQRGEDSAVPAVGERERMGIEVLNETMREAGIPVVEDIAEGERELEAAKHAEEMLNEMKKSASETRLPGEVSPFKGTVVSDADGAKVLQNLDSAIKKYEKNQENRPRSFLGDVAKALGARQYGSGSQYATFETMNGEVVTIRLADHNAHTSGFDENGRNNGISIVILRRPNEGINNDGNAHLVEYFYPDKAIQKADGQPLVEIIKSLKQSLYSGEYKDTTGLAEREEVNGNVVRGDSSAACRHGRALQQGV